MHKFSKEGIMVSKSQRGINTKDFLHSGRKEGSIIMKETTKENFVINQGRISEGMHHKEDHSLPCIKI
jgi:hypothetical protein